VQGLCPHFHLSLQSGSDVILKRMKRHYDSAQFREAVAMIHEHFPNAALTTDVMVGFPGEDEAMHQRSLEFIREIGFSKLHVFRYSKRAGTEAAMMPDQVQKEVSIRRSVDMQALGAQMTQVFLCGLIGKPQTVLIEQVRTDGTATGYTDTYVPVVVEAAAHLVKNQLITVLPLRCEDDFLYVRHAIDVVSC
jgi:threonylcarbamoyladenosine tRNA methylthiotransferase MtaB